MLIYKDENLEKYKKENLNINPNWNRRNFVNCVCDYANSSTEKILAIGGLRGTGKTVGILQALEHHDILYLSSQEGESETAEDYINLLRDTDKKTIVIDEYSWIKDREKLDKYLLTSVQNHKRIVLTATESISLEFLNYGKLNHRVNTIHTTMFTYEEYLRLYNKEHSKANCKNFLMTGGLFEEYVVINFDSARQYIDDAIVSNLAGYLKNEMNFDVAKTLTYSVLYKAICPSNLSEVPTLRKNHTTLENFLEQMGINTDYIPEEKDILRVADVFKQAGIIERIPNFDKNSELKEQYYIVNPSLTCQLIKETYGLADIENSILGHVFESTVAIQLSANMLSDHVIYFYNNGSEKNNPDNIGLDIVITDKEQEFAYLFECKYKQSDTISSDKTLRSGFLEEHEFKDIDILGRYVVYNGKPSVQEYEVGTVIFTPIGDILNNYFEFDENVKIISSLKIHNQKDDRNKPNGPTSGISSATKSQINSWHEFGKEVNKNIKKIVSEEKARVQYSFEHIVKQIEHSIGLSR
ncbi:MAG: AAA family ATPase [Lachnospiraceae bacterium]